MGVLLPCRRESQTTFLKRKETEKNKSFLTLVSQPLHWSDINIVFQFCLLHEVVSHRWKTLPFKLSHSLSRSAWRLPGMQFWNKEAPFWFLHSVTFFDWVRLVGMEINTVLCIWCSLISSPHCLQVEAREVCVCVVVSVSAGICELNTNSISQRVEHNNSTTWQSKLLLCSRQKEQKRQRKKAVWNESEQTESERSQFSFSVILDTCLHIWLSGSSPPIHSCFHRLKSWLYVQLCICSSGSWKSV